MIERVEINNDITRNEPIREVRQTNDARTGEATKKKFVAELEKQLSPKKKNDARKDEMILKEEKNPDEEEDSKDRKKI